MFIVFFQFPPILFTQKTPKFDFAQFKYQKIPLCRQKGFIKAAEKRLLAALQIRRWKLKANKCEERRGKRDEMNESEVKKRSNEVDKYCNLIFFWKMLKLKKFYLQIEGNRDEFSMGLKWNCLGGVNKVCMKVENK